jgi:serine/threonine-protein kinase
MFYKKRLSQFVVAAVMSVPASLSVALVAQAQNFFGTITYSEATGNYGYSYDYASRSVAEAEALQECESLSGFGDCRVLVSFRNACGALATNPEGAYGSGWGADRSTAERYAIESCNQYGRNCRVIRWVCTTR